MGFEPMMGVLQTPALPLGYVAAWSWCRGGDLNPYALTGTAPSRRRVYQFHHLGIIFNYRARVKIDLAKVLEPLLLEQFVSLVEATS